MSEAVELTGEPNAKVVAPAAADRQRIQSAGVGASSWAKLGSGSAGEHVKGCRCCFPPDQMFEDACQDIVGFGLPGIGSMQAEKFVRLCAGCVGSMTLSKGKFKTALKLRKGLPLTPQEVDDMQACVHRAYGPVLQQLGLGDI